MQCTHRSTDANFCLYSASEQTGAKPPPAPPLPALAAPPADAAADELLLTGRVIDTLQPRHRDFTMPLALLAYAC